MASKISLTKENFKQLYAAFDHYYPEGLVYSSDKPFSLGDFNWGTRKDFIDFVSRLTGVSIYDEKDIIHIKQAQVALDLMEKGTYLEEKTTEVNDKLNATTPDKFLREQQEAARAKREEELKAITKEETAKVREEIERVKALEEKLKNQKINYEVQKNKVEEPKEVENLHEQASANPQEFIDKTTEQFKNNPNLKGLTPQEAEITAKQAAVTLHGILTDNPDSPIFQSIIADKIVSDPESLSRLISNPQDQIFFKNLVSNLNSQSSAQLELTNLFVDVSKINHISGVTFLHSPGVNSREFNVSNIATQHINLLGDQNQLLGSLTGFGEGQIKSRIISSIGGRLESYIAKLPANSVFSKIYSSETVQLGLSSLGIVEAAPWVAAEGSWFGQLAVSSGFGPVASFVQTKLGINLGVQVAAKAVGSKVAGAVTGEVVAGAVGGEITGAAVGAAAGSVVPIVGNIVGLVVGLLGPKVIGWIKDNAQKYGKYIVVAAGAGLGLLFGGVLGATLGGILAFGGITILSGGVPALSSSMSSLGSVIAGFFGALGEATLGTVGVPILATLIGFPLLVALILFIINSGAYVTPPEMSLLSSANPYIDVQKTADPAGQIASPTSITYTVTITAKKDNLTGISFQNKCQGIKKSGGNLDCSNLEKLPSPSTLPPSISPGTPFSFTFTSAYDSRYQNTLVSDTVTVSAVSDSGGNVSETGAASVCFGDCPLNCFKTVDNGEPWPSNYKANLDAAAATLGGTYPNFAAKACAAGPINLCYTTSNPSPVGSGLCAGTIYARHIHNTASCDINFNQCGLHSGSDSLFMLTHEVTHHIQTISPNYERLFEQNVPQTEWPLCTYSATGSDPYESEAEGDALFVGKPSWNGCVSSFISQYPRHYQFAKNVMFGP